MRETHKSICDWADATFGRAPSAFRVAARANEEVAELLRAVSSSKPAEEIAEEAADVAIVLCRLAGIVGVDPFKVVKDWIVKVHPNGVAPCAVDLNYQMAIVVASSQRGSGLSASRVAVVTCFGNLVNLCATLNRSLYDAIDTKMEVNRTRLWKRDGTGHGYHERAAG